MTRTPIFDALVAELDTEKTISGKIPEQAARPDDEDGGLIRNLAGNLE